MDKVNFKVDISIVIPVKNGIKEGIERCLNEVLRQKTNLHYEIIVIDSGSTDGSLEIIKTFLPIRLIQIKPEEFGHGRTRNLGAKEAKGKYLVFLNADAWPVNEWWLETLLENFSCDEKIAAVYSCHLPKENCPLYMRRDLEKIMPSSKVIKSKIRSFDFMLFSTVSAAIRKEIWEKFPFDDQIVIAEDQDWARRVIAAGYAIVYEPSSLVYHSHHYPPLVLFKIKFSVGKEYVRKIYQGRQPIRSLIFFLGGLIVKVLGDFLYIAKSNFPFSHKVKEMIISITSRLSSFTGRFLGEVVG